MNSRFQVTSRNRKQFKLRRFVWQWHRRFGVGIAVLVVLLCVTGVLLNHTESLGLDGKNINNSIILSLYGIERPQTVSFESSGNWFAQLGKRLYFNENSVFDCDGLLVGVINLKDQGIYVAACENELLLVSESGELVEKIGSLYQLPVPVSSVGLCESQPCLQVSGNHHLLDVNGLSWEPISVDAMELSQTVSPPKALFNYWQNAYIGNAISLERLVLDIHSGRILGSLGVVIMDICAILLSVLVVSGVWLWLKSVSPKR